MVGAWCIGAIIAMCCVGALKHCVLEDCGPNIVGE
jgi:hypothetical protein